MSRVTITNPNYPTLLKQTSKPPDTLYYVGDIEVLKKPLLAVVGSRKVSSYGERITEKITTEAVHAGLGIVSGLAFGIDTIAHKAALSAGGITVAVLGSGLDTIYPASNKVLAQDIIKKGGLLLSEFPPGTSARPYHFPIRNQTISGISLGVLVTEAREKSGSLITAHAALDQNREVFAIPGPIDQPGSYGTNDLIKRGAVVVTTIYDILDELQLEKTQKQIDFRRVSPENDLEKQLLELLGDEPLHVDKLSRLARLDINVVNSTLVVLEMKGLVTHQGGQIYAKRS